LQQPVASLPAMLTAVSGMVANDALDAARADAADKAIAPADSKLPHSTDAVIALSAKAGLGITAGQDIQLANGETAAVMSGADTQFTTGGQLRMHSGQAIGVLGCAVAAGQGGIGLQMIAAKDAIDVQAQADILKVQARDDVQLTSVGAHVDWAAAKRIILSTSGGANITSEGSNITVQAPGKITIHAGKKSFVVHGNLNYPLPRLPTGEPVCIDCLLKALKSGTALAVAECHWKLSDRIGGHCTVSVVDHERMLLRLADTRVLAVLPHILEPTQWRAYTEPLAYWLVLERDGLFTSLKMAQEDIKSDEVIRLRQPQINTLLQASQPDAIIALLRETMSDIVPNEIRNSALHALITASCELSVAHGIEVFADTFALAVAACLTMGETKNSTEVKRLLSRRHWQTGESGDHSVRFCVMRV
jgi:uncharacterized protein (DUF2345 family)